MFRRNLLVLLCASLVFGYPEPDNRPVQTGAQPPKITIPLGEIEGAVLRSRLGKPFFAFRGIHYAKPPINELRFKVRMKMAMKISELICTTEFSVFQSFDSFKDPVPVEKWDNVLNATADGPSCPQPTTDPISEDCLILNVYTTKLPKHNENMKRPVIVYFHSGGFYSVSSISSWTGPQYFMDQDIVLVTVNYRLGSLGM